MKIELIVPAKNEFKPPFLAARHYDGDRDGGSGHVLFLH